MKCHTFFIVSEVVVGNTKSNVTASEPGEVKISGTANLKRAH